MVIWMQLDNAAVRQVRVAYSPLGELSAALRARVPPREGSVAGVRQTSDRFESLLHTLIPAVGASPSSLSPAPDLTGRRTIDDELHRVATRPGSEFLAEVRQVLTGDPTIGLPARRVPAEVRALVDRQGDALGAVVAEALAAQWQQVVGPRWPAIRDRLDADLDRRGRQLAGGGIDALLTGLNRRLRWGQARLAVDKPYTEDLGVVSSLTLVPSVHLQHTVLVTGSPASAARISYPAYGRGQPALTGSPDTMADLIGGTRARLLADLAEPSATDGLAVRHGLAPSTVSYHLQVLHRAGLVTRTRQGLTVRYHRSPLGDALVRGR